jgi:uncharacterized protein YsxB (DUF464 family)
MIKVTFNPDKLKLQVKGHADHGKKGEDIVCAAVSTLFYTLGEALWESRDMLQEPPNITDDNGYGFIICKPKPEYEGNIARTYWTILVGFELIAKNYAKNLKIEVKKEKVGQKAK